MTQWIHVVGLGEDGLEGLSGPLKQLVKSADVVLGGTRHLQKLPEGFLKSAAKTVEWGRNFHDTLAGIETMRGQNVVVLASGDPMFYGVGTTLLKHFSVNDVKIYPHPGAFSLAASRMGWSLADVETLTVHGRPLAILNRYLFDQARLLILSRDGDTPAEVAELLTDAGYGESRISVFEHMGGNDENRIDGIAKNWDGKKTADLNTIAVELVAARDAVFLSLVPGLADEDFIHDGQISKREVRAMTLARLAPRPGELLWDIGSGSGSVAIEWMRAHPSLKAVAIEQNSARTETIAKNASRLGVPGLEIIHGMAPDCFAKMEKDADAIFIGGGLKTGTLLDQAWQRLRPGGRLLANAVTVSSQSRLLEFGERHHSEFIRIAIERSAPIGRFSALKPLRSVLQLVLEKPRP